MSSSSDYMVDRRRLRRKLGFWRIAAIGAALLAALVAVAKFSGLDTMEKAAPHIARLSIEGIITGDDHPAHQGHRRFQGERRFVEDRQPRRHDRGRRKALFGVA
jgi:hypothetical protein